MKQIKKALAKPNVPNPISTGGFINVKHPAVIREIKQEASWRVKLGIRKLKNYNIRKQFKKSDSAKLESKVKATKT